VPQSERVTQTLTTYLGEGDQDISARIERRLSYGQSKSEWMKVGLRDRLAIEAAAASAGVELPDDRDARDRVLRQAIHDYARAGTDGGERGVGAGAD